MIEKVNDKIFRLAIPVPFPMKYVYCYLIKNGDNSILIDTGFNYRKAKEVWLNIFSELNIEPKQIESIYLTHFHPDHSSLSGWMQDLTQAKVYMSKADRDMFYRVFSPNSKQPDRVREMVIKHGVPTQLANDIATHMDQLGEKVTPLPTITELHELTVKFGDEAWEVIPTPGHSDGHVCFYQRDHRILISGDHILDPITPNISLWPGGHDNPLQSYVESLRMVRELSVDKALTAHGDIITNLNERIDQILRHHDERLKIMMGLTSEGSTAYEVALHTFKGKTLSAHQWRFAMAETLSHLELMVKDNELTKNEKEEKVYYEKNKVKI